MMDKGTARSAEVGAAIRQVRRSKKMTQYQLAEALGKTLRTVQKYETGEIDLTVSSLERVAVILNVKPWELLGYGQVGDEGTQPNAFEVWATGFADGFKGGVAFAENCKDGNCS